MVPSLAYIVGCGGVETNTKAKKKQLIHVICAATYENYTAVLWQLGCSVYNYQATCLYLHTDSSLCPGIQMHMRLL